jgi:DNA-binding transcriptional ArsR family regulator
MPPPRPATSLRSKSARPRVASEPRRRELTLSKVLAALSDPTRLDIVQYLAAAGDELNCSACSCPERSKSTMAHHFKVLREAGVIGTREEGTQLFNRLRRDDLDTRFPGLLDAVLQSAPAVRR